MYCYQQTTLLRRCIRPLLVGALAVSLLVIHSTHTFAAACNPATPIDASTGTPVAACDMSISAVVNSGVLTLANDAAAVVVGSPFTLTGIAQTPTFTFTSLVKDHRGLNNGWILKANSAGIVNGGTTLPLLLTAKDVASTCTNGSCTYPSVFTAITLTTTSVTFMTAGITAHGGSIVDGDYSNKIDGSFTIPPGSPPGTYSGTITITLLNTF